MVVIVIVANRAALKPSFLAQAENFYEQQTGTRKRLKEIITSAEGSDPFAIATLDRLIHFFGLAISNIINILDPDVIVLGGGVGNIEELYTRGVEEAEKFVFNQGLVQRSLNLNWVIVLVYLVLLF